MSHKKWAQQEIYCLTSHFWLHPTPTSLFAIWTYLNPFPSSWAAYFLSYSLAIEKTFNKKGLCLCYHSLNTKWNLVKHGSFVSIESREDKKCLDSQYSSCSKINSFIRKINAWNVLFQETVTFFVTVSLVKAPLSTSVKDRKILNDSRFTKGSTNISLESQLLRSRDSSQEYF